MDKLENFSESISLFLRFIRAATEEYNFCYEKVGEQDKLTQDYLHSLELDGLKYSERSKLATLIMTNRKDRRFFKDRVEELRPIIAFLEDPQNQKVFNRLSVLLGEVRKQESRHQNRIYIPKVLKGKIFGEEANR